MINFHHKCIFIAVPKTGSTSLRDLMRRKNTKKILLEYLIMYNSRIPYQNIQVPHQPIQKYRNFMINGLSKPKSVAQFIKYCICRFYGLDFDKFFKFGFVRNPWSRTVSLYRRKENAQKNMEYKSWTFEQFVDWIQFSSDTCIHVSGMKNQLDWFTDKNGKIIVDYIGKFETLEKDWIYISNKLGIKENLLHMNNRKYKKHYTEYYNEKTREIIRKKFIVDIEHFGYEFEDSR